MSTGAIVTLSPRDYDAVLFDMDGVLTQTATVHAAAWKKLFDDFLQARAAKTAEPFDPFDIDLDYRRYVDGKPRLDGVEAFLESRGIHLPHGAPDDPADAGTVHALGRLKDRYFMEHLAQHGVEPYVPAIALVRALRAQEVKTAVVSSSNNCEAVLQAVGIEGLFDARVDGLDLTRCRLRGKPAPDAFLEAAKRLKVEARRAVVVEDAIAGVAAGRAGEFGLVVGVDRIGQSQALREAGADVVVGNLDAVQVATEPPFTWSLVYEDFDAACEGVRESLCALGNGYFETRGAMPWVSGATPWGSATAPWISATAPRVSSVAAPSATSAAHRATADRVHYPGTYVAGGYNREITEIEGRAVENEDLVNFPNWLVLEFRIDDGDWFDIRAVTILSYRQELDLRQGVLLRQLRFEDGRGRRSTLTERRFVSMADMHLGALELTLTAENWSATVRIRSAIDGRVVNAGAKLYEEFDNTHLEPLAAALVGDDGVGLLVHTRQSDLHVAQAARTRAFLQGELLDAARQTVEGEGYIGQELNVEVAHGDTLVIEKIAVLYTSRDHAISECSLAAHKSIERAARFESLLAEHVLAWKHLWRRFDINLLPADGEFALNLPMLLRLNMFHLLQAASLNSIGLDIGVPARGWTGEAYQGHIFWDELFILPTLIFRTPEIARSLIMYRYRRLDEARAAAKGAGFEGAMFPWQSGSDGQEETLEFNLNQRSQRWVRDNSYLQRHVGSAIAYNVWQYFQVTGDIEFLQFYGAELILEVARFWASIATFDDTRGRYEICGVMGPDEFHEGYPRASAPGLKNNAYTNIMAVWVLWRALDVLDCLPDLRRVELMTRLRLSSDDVERWRNMSRRMFVPFHRDDGSGPGPRDSEAGGDHDPAAARGAEIISQFEGYEKLVDLDWEAYRMRYGNIQRLDLILEAENDSANRYKLSKQADVLMLFYLFSSEELASLFERLGYPFEYETIPRNVAYYDCRSSHGSTLSRVVHAWVLARSDRPRALRYFAEALQSDVSDIQQGTTAEGVHLGAMAGTVDLVQRVTTGIEVTGDVLRLNPQLPAEVERLDMRIRYRGHTLDLRLTRETLTVRGRERGVPPIRLAFRDEVHDFTGGSTRVFELPSVR